LGRKKRQKSTTTRTQSALLFTTKSPLLLPIRKNISTKKGLKTF
jgi:hypothetical protein